MNKKNLLKKIRANAKNALIVFALAMVVLVTAFIGYYIEFKQKVLPKSYIVSGNVAGMSKEELSSRIGQIHEAGKQNKISLKFEDKSWEMTLESAGWKLLQENQTDKIFSVGHSQIWYKNIWPLARCIFARQDYDVMYEFDEKKVEDWIDSINGEIGTPKKEANIQIKKGELQIIEPQAGKEINLDKLAGSLENIFSLTTKDAVILELSDDNPVISKQEAESLSNKARQLVSEEVTLVAPEGEIVLSSRELGLMIELKKNVQSKKGLFGSKNEYSEAYVSFSEDEIREILDDNADRVNTDPADAKFSIVDGKVSILQASSDGKVVKTDDAIKQIISALETGKQKEIELPLEVKKASVSADEISDIEKYGIKELVGTATTSFTGSTTNRIQNIKIGVQFISGTLVKPGEEFSTIAHLGAIDGSSGYLQELVIKENETIPEFGGGLCQVSTTLFRSVMNAGMEITERHNHSYRVSYYEPPVGMDATIYSPRPDFKFKNDYNGYILIQGRVEGKKITFDIYGSKDDREVEITDPYVYDITDPPADIYIDDPGLAPGEVKRIDRSHQGAKAVFYYRVKKGGETNEQKFLSSYVGWPAKYLRGPQTGEQPTTPAQ
jgi:vancomycin resistance protein YoaR